MKNGFFIANNVGKLFCNKVNILMVEQDSQNYKIMQQNQCKKL